MHTCRSLDSDKEVIIIIIIVTINDDRLSYDLVTTSKTKINSITFLSGADLDLRDRNIMYLLKLYQTTIWCDTQIQFFTLQRYFS